MKKLIMLLVASMFLSACSSDITTASTKTSMASVYKQLVAQKPVAKVAATTPAEAQKMVVLKLFLGMFNATPGADLLNLCAGFLASGMSESALANLLAGTALFQSESLYPNSLSNLTFSLRFMNNLVGSTVTEANKTALAAQLAELLNAGWKRGDAMWLLVAALANVPVSNPDWGNAALQLNNRLTVSYYYSVTKANPSSDLATLQAVTASITNNDLQVKLNFKRGINFGNRLDAPTEGEWAPALDPQDFSMAAKRGFDHIRLPVRFSAHSGPAPTYTIDETFFTRVDWAIQQALDNKLSVIIDWHHFSEIHADPFGQRNRFLAIWGQIAARYKKYPDSVAFELLNEPNGTLNTAWNQLLAEAIKVVRSTNPTRIIIAGGPNYSKTDNLKDLILPDDPNVVASVHMYEPDLFTLQGASFMGPEYGTSGIIFPGPPLTPITPVQAAQNVSWTRKWFIDYNTLYADQNPSGPKTVLKQISDINDYINLKRRTVYIGEWGASSGADMQSRINYMKMIREESEKAGVAWAVWEDASSFKLFDRNTGTWLEPMTSALLP